MSTPWKTKETPKGILKYRMPNIAEGYFYLSLVDRLKASNDVIKTKGLFLQEMGNLIDWASVGYESYSDLLFDKENMTLPVSEIVNELFDDVVGAFRKKT